MSAILSVLANTIPTGHTLNEVLSTPGASTWTPPAWAVGATITVQAWGAGANGADYGGGGGEFAQSNFTVTGDVDYFIGSPSDGIYDTTVWDTLDSQIPSAVNANGQTGGTGGSGDVLYDGGAGGTSGGGFAGGGGSSASPTSAGTSGGDGLDGGLGGVPIGSPAGTGGDGSPVDGFNGTSPGAGGGGSSITPGLGADGMIRLIYPPLA